MLTLLLTCFLFAAPSQQAGEWKTVTAPEIWKQAAAEIDRQGGFAWFACRFRVPAAWSGRELKLYAEASDDARAIYVNDLRVGQFGQFPPEFRSGLGKEAVFAVPAAAWRAGEDNVIAVRLYQRQARERFNVAPLLVLAGDQALRLEGSWLMRLGDASPAAVLAAMPQDQPVEPFAELIDADDAYRDRRRLPDDAGPLSPADSLSRMNTPDDLQVELALGDPDIGQPLQIKFDQRGRMWVAEYLQYPDPAGLKMVSRDKFLRTVYDKVPLPPPHHARGRDRISIHEDRDGDGYYETHGVFADGLNLATSFALGRGGVFVLNPPYLLFYPDRNRDDQPDGDPEVLLEGFGLEDSHSLANSLRWGPDGWLYAAQGSTVTGDIRRYGSQDPPVHSLGQLIWRYHPETRRYEIFAEGGGNAFGVELDQSGRIYSGHNGGDTRGFHYVQGGYYQKGFGKHGELSNPFAYGYFPPMAHPNVPRFTHTFLIYESQQLPPKYQGVLFGPGPLQGHIVMSRVGAGSFQLANFGYRVRHHQRRHMVPPSRDPRRPRWRGLCRRFL